MIAEAQRHLPAPPAPAAAPVTALDHCLAELGRALQGADAAAIERAAAVLHEAIDRAAAALREPGALTPALRRQLALTVGRIAAQREVLARASASVDRAIEVLLPAAAPANALYSPSGAATRGHLGATARA